MLIANKYLAAVKMFFGITVETRSVATCRCLNLLKSSVILPERMPGEWLRVSEQLSPGAFGVSLYQL